MAKKNFLDIDDTILKNQLLLGPTEDELDSLNLPIAGEWTRPKEAHVVTPLPGLCVKVKNNDEKIFINIVHSEDIAAPDDLNDAQLAEILESDSASEYKIPMSLLEPHEEKDTTGKQCLAYDVLINTNFLRKVEANDLFRTFFIVVVLEGIEDKYSQEIDKRNWILLKNKKYLGTKIPKHHIRNRLISEVGARSCFSEKKVSEVPSKAPESKKPLITEVKSSTKDGAKSEDPAGNILYQIVKVPSKGPVSHLAGEFYLPDAKTIKEIVFLLGRDRVIVEHGNKKTDVFLPYDMDTEGCEAKFDRSRHMLTVRIPVIKASA